MLNNVILYYRENGKTLKTMAPEVEDYRTAIWAVRSQILGCKDKWFDVKGPVMAVVQK